MTTKNEIGEWFDEGVSKGATHMIVVCDTYDHEDYPVYIMPKDDFYKRYEGYNGKDMQRVMEVYDLSMDKARQLSEFRANHPPVRSEAASV